MEIVKVSLKNRYGWRTIDLSEFLQTFDVKERKQLISNPDKAFCLNEFGEAIKPEEAFELLEKLKERAIKLTEIGRKMK